MSLSNSYLRILDEVIARARDGEIPSPSWTQANHRCYELIEELGRAGFSCFTYARPQGARRGLPPQDAVFCSLEDGKGRRFGAWAAGAGDEAVRAAVCKAYLRARELGVVSAGAPSA